jgi:hypothetical protein
MTDPMASPGAYPSCFRRVCRPDAHRARTAPALHGFFFFFEKGGKDPQNGALL